MLAALDLARRIEAGELTSRAVIELCAEAIAANEAKIGAFVALDHRRGTARGGRGRSRLDAAARSAGRGQGHLRYRRSADAIRIADLCWISAAGRCGSGRPGAPRRRFGSRQDRDHRICLYGARGHPQSAKPCAYARRLVFGLGRSGRRSDAADRAWQSDRRLGHPAGGVLRCRRLQAVLSLDPDRRHEMFRLASRYASACYAAGVADVAFAAAAIAGRDLRVDRGTPAAPRIGLVRTHLWPQASAAMHGAIEAAARAAQSAGAAVTELALPPILEEAYRAQFIIQDYEAFRALASEYDRHRDEISRPLREQCSTAPRRSRRKTYDAARRTASRARRAFGDLMGEYDVMLTPSAPGAAPQGFGSTGDRGIQPALDADGSAVRQRSGIERRRLAAGRTDHRPLRPRSRGAGGGAVFRARDRTGVSRRCSGVVIPQRGAPLPSDRNSGLAPAISRLRRTSSFCAWHNPRPDRARSCRRRSNSSPGD